MELLKKRKSTKKKFKNPKTPLNVFCKVDIQSPEGTRELELNIRHKLIKIKKTTSKNKESMGGKKEN